MNTQESVTVRARRMSAYQDLMHHVVRTGYSQRRLPARVQQVKVSQALWTIEFYDSGVFRFVADKIDIERYRWHHDRGELMYQRLGRPRPSHYPDLEQNP